jgi:hypothetical protein
VAISGGLKQRRSPVAGERDFRRDKAALSVGRCRRRFPGTWSAVPVSFSRIFQRLLSQETMGNFWVIFVCMCDVFRC